MTRMMRQQTSDVAGGTRGDVLPRPARPGRKHAQDPRPVLIVDDNEYVRLYLRKLLAMVGFRSVAATDGAEALDLLARHKPFLAVLDIRLPGMSGPELGWKMKCAMPGIHLAAISGDFGSWEPDDLIDLGFERLFWKPLDRGDFLRYCREVGKSEVAVSAMPALGSAR